MSSNSDQGPVKDAAAYFTILGDTLSSLSRDRVDELTDILFNAYAHSKTTFLFGNGGSASLATHFACDLSKGTSVSGRDRKRFRAIALTDNIPIMTAWSNDSNFEDIFAEQLQNLVEAGDVAFAISCSGNSPNVIKALKFARDHGALTVGLGGFRGGKMKDLCDVCLVVPSDNMQIIEDIHLSVAHCVFTTLKHRIDALAVSRINAVASR